MTPVYPRVITWARGLAVASFVALAALVYIRYVHAIAQLGALTNVQTVATNARAVESLLVDAESGVRGYVITADDTYLEPYRRATAQLPPVLATLRGATSSDASQQEALTVFNAAVKRELDTLGETIESRRSEGFEAARDIVAAGRGPAALSDLRAATDRILSGARNRVIQARAEDFESTRVTRYLMLFLFVFAVGLLLVAGFGMARELRRRARVEQQLQEAYDEVEERVRRRTQELIDNHRRLVESEGRAQELAMVRSDLLQREQAARADASFSPPSRTSCGRRSTPLSGGRTCSGTVWPRATRRRSRRSSATPLRRRG